MPLEIKDWLSIVMFVYTIGKDAFQNLKKKKRRRPARSNRRR